MTSVVDPASGLSNTINVCVCGRLMTQKEYIIPLAFDSRSFSLFNKNLPANQQSPIREGISSLEQSVSIRPRVMIDRSVE